MSLSDLRYALRSLSKARGFTLAVVLTLGLGLGANTAIFSVVRGVLLRPLPHQDGDRLMYLRQSMSAVDNIAFSVPEINDFRQQSRTLGQVAEYSPLTLPLVEDQDATQIDVGLVTGNYLSVMGLRPVLGRPFNDGDDGAGAAPVVMLTDGYWRTHFAADPGIVGRQLRIGGRPVEVIGVLQPAPFFPGRIDALMNMSISEHHVSAMMVQGRTHRMTEMIARLAPGATVEQARAEVEAITQRMYAANPETYEQGAGYRISMTPLHVVLGQDARLTLLLLMGAAAFVLVIACANVANLTLMRGVRREHELLVRTALGAGSARLRRLLLVENAVLAAGGAALGLVLAFGGVGMLATFAARFSPRSTEIRVDAVVLGFAVLLALVVAVLLSFAPNVGSEHTLGAQLSAGATRSSGGLRRRRLQQALVVTQVAVSLVLLTGAGLLVRSMQRLAAVDPGLEPGNVLTMEVPVDFTQAASLQGAVGMYQRMQTELSTLPGVEIVGVGSTMPLRSAQFQLEIKAEGRTLSPGEATLQTEYRTADPGYFRASGIRLLKGRDFTDNDGRNDPRVVILNETAANILFPGIDPVGRRVAWTGELLRFIGISDEWRTVVGIVGDTKDGGLDRDPVPVTFTPFAQGDFPSGGVVMRTEVDAAGLATAARAIVRSVAPAQPIENLLTVDDIRDESVGPRRLNALLVGSFGLLALVVAAIGIAAVLAFSVASRQNEIGIRMSLGADSGRVQRMVLREGGILLGIGVLAGVAGAMAATRLMRGLLFGVTPNDPLTLGGVALLMVAVGVAACWLPARRAARVDPAVAMRGQ